MGGLFLEPTALGYFGLLSDEIIVMILEYLESKDLYNVLWTCRRLQDVALEKKLWKGKIEDLPDDKIALEYIANNLLNETTKKVKLRGAIDPLNRGYRSSFCPSLMQKLIANGQQMTHLHLIQQQLDGNTFRLLNLPKSLRLLDMTGSNVTNLDDRSHYFKDIHLHLTHLEDLDLTFCRWVSSHSLMAISKLPQLTRLSLRGCRTFGECLAYVSLSCRFGFRALKILDVTDTMIGSCEFTSFGGIPTLEEFYFGQYDYYIDNQYTLISDICLSRIRNSITLRVLDMSGSKVTDGSLETLRTLPNLQRIDAHFTHLSAAGIQEFQRRMPNCSVNKVESVILPPLTENDTNRQLGNLLAPGAIEILIGLANHH